MPAARVRLVTNMRVYWDQILVGRDEPRMPLTMQTVPTSSRPARMARLLRDVTPDGREPFGYDYERVDATAPWKLMPGRYTREGDVTRAARGPWTIASSSRVRATS